MPAAASSRDHLYLKPTVFTQIVGLHIQLPVRSLFLMSKRYLKLLILVPLVPNPIYPWSSHPSRYNSIFAAAQNKNLGVIFTVLFLSHFTSLPSANHTDTALTICAKLGRCYYPPLYHLVLSLLSPNRYLYFFSCPQQSILNTADRVTFL